MTNLTTTQEVPYVPSLPGNKEAKEPFTLLLTAGRTVLELREFSRRMGVIQLNQDTPEALAAEFNKSLEGFVKLAPGSHTLNGQLLTSVGQYLSMVALQPGIPLVDELIERVTKLNTVEGLRELFFGRSSGGSTGTGKTETAPETAAT